MQAAGVEKLFQGQTTFLIPRGQLLNGGVVLLDVPQIIGNAPFLQPGLGLLADAPEGGLVEGALQSGVCQQLGEGPATALLGVGHVVTPGVLEILLDHAGRTDADDVFHAIEMEQLVGIDANGGNAHAGRHDRHRLVLIQTGIALNAANVIDQLGLGQKGVGDELRAQRIARHQHGFGKISGVAADMRGGRIAHEKQPPLFFLPCTGKIYDIRYLAVYAVFRPVDLFIMQNHRAGIAAIQVIGHADGYALFVLNGADAGIQLLIGKAEVIFIGLSGKPVRRLLMNEPVRNPKIFSDGDHLRYRKCRNR